MYMYTMYLMYLYIYCADVYYLCQINNWFESRQVIVAIVLNI